MSWTSCLICRLIMILIIKTTNTCIICLWNVFMITNCVIYCFELSIQVFTIMNTAVLLKLFIVACWCAHRYIHFYWLDMLSHWSWKLMIVNFCFNLLERTFDSSVYIPIHSIRLVWAPITLICISNHPRSILRVPGNSAHASWSIGDMFDGIVHCHIGWG